LDHFSTFDGRKMTNPWNKIIVGVLCMSSLYSKDLYSVRMWGIPVATVEMYGTDSTYNDIPARFVYFSTKTSPLTSKIFFVDNQYTLWVDPIDHRTLSFQKSTIQPGVVNSLATEMMNNNILFHTTPCHQFFYFHHGHQFVLVQYGF